MGFHYTKEPKTRYRSFLTTLLCELVGAAAAAFDQEADTERKYGTCHTNTGSWRFEEGEGGVSCAAGHWPGLPIGVEPDPYWMLLSTARELRCCRRGTLISADQLPPHRAAM